MKALFAPVDMTQGSPGKQIVAFTIPMLLGNIAQQLYNTADSVIVGQFVGDNALAAVGSAMPILNLLLVLFVGISVGAGIMVSQYFGARQKEELSKSIGCCITMTAVSSVVMMAVTPFVTKPLLLLLNTPESILDWCNSYLIILFCGSAGLFFFNILGGILRGLGDSVSALLYLLIATLVNIVLDYVFVAYFDMGVAGVALATVIAQCLSAILLFLKLCGMKDVFTMDKKYLLPEKTYLVSLLRLGLPSGLTQAIFSMSMVVVQSLTNSFGELFIAANVIVMRVDGFAMMPAFSFGTAMTTYAGQNVGARRMDRVVQGARQGTLLAAGVSTVITLAILLWGRYLMAIFTKTPELVELSFLLMKILAAGYIAMEITQCLSGIMRGAGDTMAPMWISVVATVIVRIPLAYGIAYFTRSPQQPGGSWYCISVSLLAAWVLGACVTVLCYRIGWWKKKALWKDDPPSDRI
jgi:putative MATE family efflux protein